MGPFIVFRKEDTMDKNKKLSKIFLLCVSIQTILIGILFIIQVLRIYIGNNQEYNMSICGKYLLQLLPVILLWIALIILSYIYFRKSNSKENNKSKLTNLNKLKIYEYMLVESDDPSLVDVYKMINSEKKKRLIYFFINLGIVLICSLMGILYMLNIEHFNSQGNLTQQAIDMTIHLIPWVIISFISSIQCYIFIERSANISIELIKTVINKTGRNNSNSHTQKSKNLRLLIVRSCIILVAVGLIIHGVINGGLSDVFQKAINICTECIGLG